MKHFSYDRSTNALSRKYKVALNNLKQFLFIYVLEIHLSHLKCITRLWFYYTGSLDCTCLLIYLNSSSHFIINVLFLNFKNRDMCILYGSLVNMGPIFLSRTISKDEKREIFEGTRVLPIYRT